MHGMGRVAEIGDPASLAGAILEVLGDAEKLKGDPSEIARQYNPDTIAAEYEKLFEKLMEKKR
jgi:glycosyltransferase involved in cell wall biosynthesis